MKISVKNYEKEPDVLFKDLKIGGTFKLEAEKDKEDYKDIFYLKVHQDMNNAWMFDTSCGERTSCTICSNAVVIPVESELIFHNPKPDR